MYDYYDWDNKKESDEPEVEKAPLLRPSLKLLQQQKRQTTKWLIAAGGISTLAIAVYIAISSAAKNATPQPQIDIAQLRSQQVAETANQYAIADRTLNQSLGQTTYTIPIDPNTAGLQQVAEANAGGRIKERINKQMSDPKSPAYNAPVRHPVVATHRAIATNVVEQMLVPASLGTIAKASYKITYSSGKTVEFAIDNDQVMADGLSRFRAYLYAMHPVNYAVPLSIALQNLRRDYANFVDAQITLLGIQEGIDAPLAIDTVRSAYRDTLQQSWTDLPSIAPVERTNSLTQPLPPASKPSTKAR